MTSYEKDTLNGYLTKERVTDYKYYHTRSFSWGRLITWREQRSLRKFFDKVEWSQNDRLLDIPCGTGILGRAISRFPGLVVASDISEEMLKLAKDGYTNSQHVDFVQADIVNTYFDGQSFSCVVTLGFLHRVPAHIKSETLEELFRLTNRYAIISFSANSFLQRSKHFFLKLVKSSHIPASHPIAASEALKQCRSVGFSSARIIKVLPFFSSHTIVVLQK